MPTIAFCNLKGGTGKTTSAVYTATALQRAGFAVAVYDCDPQGSATEWAELAEEASTPLPFEVIPANARTLKRLADVGEKWALIDCPPGNSQIIDSAIDIADHVVIPTRPSGIEVDRMWMTIELAKGKSIKVLLTSTIANTKSLDQLREALQAEGMDSFRGTIPQREKIKNSFGELPIDLFGYQAVATELIGE